MLKQNLLIVILVCLSLCALIAAEDKGKASKEKGKDKKDELTLEKLFPEKSFFGPSARSMEFSFDGKYAAYIYRPYKERRHGSDLWIYDVAKGQARRATSVSVMSRFQESTREVKEDRIEKSKEADEKDEPKKTDKKKARDKKVRGKKKEKEQTDEPSQEPAEKKRGQRRKRSDKQADKKKTREQEKEQAKQKRLGDWVSDKDADDEKAPRYSGIESFTWSPKANALLFVSKGDIYRCKVIKDKQDKLTRLTRTRKNERQVAWLPDASGYTYIRGDDLMKVRFRSYLAEQLYVKLPDKERMTRHKISPDGKRMIFLSQKEGPEPGGREKKVNIAQYRDRFMKVKEVPRDVSDDPIKKKEVAVYTLELNELMKENSVLTEVYRHTLSQPRDYVKLPEWSPDSALAVFAVYDQVTGHVNIMETTRPEESDKEDSKDTKDKDKKRSKKKDAEDEQKKDDADKDEKRDEGTKKNPAKVLHRFLHTGGPTTPRMIRPYYLADNRRIVYMSEKTGFRQLHVLDPLYESDIHLTQGHFEVYPLDITKDHKWMFVTATKEHPARLDVYKVSLDDGEMSRLSQEDGYYGDAAVSPNGTKVLANFAHYGAPRELVFVDTESQDQKQLTDSHPPAAHEFTKARPEFFSYKNRHEQEIQGFMFKPEDPNMSEKHPLLIYIYGGPLGTRKSVVEGHYQSSAYFFAYYMAKKHGYVTCTIDPRGNSGYGGLFEKANFDQVGKPQVEDIVDGVKFFTENHNVDPNRVAVHGWSFGGFQTQMCLYTEPDVFAAGIAGAGPTEWENYNSWYTSGTIGISKPGTAELKEFSLLPLAKGLKAKLLLVHGMEDSNVLYQDTIRMYRELIKAGKETLVELFLDPTGGHGLGGDVKNLSRYRKYEEFLLRTVGSGKEQKED
jgi:dipeptidyl aminopeptidase/acylaminoacyl peptidase